ncbi:hypothetical protein [Alteromonas gracilis]|uniref:hypothetical protein n=1 Tax=Alteromonas gracilis TaxID=1479524 RepID=UPI003736B6D4
MKIGNVKRVKKSALNSKVNKTVAGLFGVLGIYMLLINLAVYGNVAPLWIVALSVMALLFLPLTKVEDDKGRQYLAYWGIVFKSLNTEAFERVSQR